MLPENFYDFKSSDDCKGCRGCKSDDFVFPAVDSEINKDLINQSQSLPIEFKKLDLTSRKFI